MSDGGDDRRGGGFSDLPKWPTEAKELPETHPTEPPRARLRWALGVGALGGVLSPLRNAGRDPASLAGSVVGGFLLFAFIGLLAEYSVFQRERRRRCWEDR